MIDFRQCRENPKLTTCNFKLRGLTERLKLSKRFSRSRSRYWQMVMREGGRFGTLTSNINFQVPKLIRVSDSSSGGPTLLLEANFFANLLSQKKSDSEALSGLGKSKKLVQLSSSSYFSAENNSAHSVISQFLLLTRCAAPTALHCKRHKGEILDAGYIAPFILISTQIDQQEIDWKLFIARAIERSRVGCPQKE